MITVDTGVRATLTGLARHPSVRAALQDIEQHDGGIEIRGSIARKRLWGPDAIATTIGAANSGIVRDRARPEHLDAAMARLRSQATALAATGEFQAAALSADLPRLRWSGNWPAAESPSLLRFLITQRLRGFTVPAEPHFDEASTALFSTLLPDCRFYLEYGSGGSTVTAARLNKPFISVETDRFYLEAVRKKIGNPASNQQLVHAGIGPSGPWGYPLRVPTPALRRIQNWKAYAGSPWRLIDNAHLPDLILVDGRFRVATVLTCCERLRAQPDARILVDDYTDRPYYHVLEQFAERANVVGRMAVFRPLPQSSRALSNAIDYYSTDWR
jgi:hypothetical protein